MAWVWAPAPVIRSMPRWRDAPSAVTAALVTGWRHAPGAATVGVPLHAGSGSGVGGALGDGGGVSAGSMPTGAAAPGAAREQPADADAATSIQRIEASGRMTRCVAEAGPLTCAAISYG